MLTIPRSIFKSSTKDLSCPIFGIVIQRTRAAALRSRPERRNLMMLGLAPYRYSRHIKQGEYHRFPAWILA